MKDYNEVTCEIDISLDGLKKIMVENNFTIKEIYDVDDIYFTNKDLNSSYYELMKDCILIRDIIEEDKVTKYITHKVKEYNNNYEIINQYSINTKILSMKEGIKLIESLGYVKFLDIKDHLIVYQNDLDELVVEIIDDKIYIEIEESSKYGSIDDMKNVFSKYHIPIKNNNYFVSKAVEKLKDIRNKNEK